MVPTNSNLNKDNCSPVSSNCVIWQGPDLSCINLCNGDSVSDVVHKLAVEICDLKDQLNLSDLDLKCLVDNCITCPDPEKTLGVVLQLLINKVCDLQELIDALSGGSTSEVLVRIASCFIPDFTDSNGDITRNVPVSTYVQAIANKVCYVLSKLEEFSGNFTFINNELADIDRRLDILENEGVPQVTPVCSSSPTPKDIDVAFNGLESAFCSLRTATGLPADILNAITDNECEPVAPSTSIESLANPGNILWSGSSGTLAETLEKLWLAVCDLRAAVSIIQDTCCQVTCDDLIVDFDVVLDYDVLTDEFNLVFFFGEKTNLPLAFGDCNETLGTKFTITDALGHTNTFYIKIREDVLNDPTVLTNGYVVPLPANIDQSKEMYLTSNICITNGELNCVKCVSKTILPKPCQYCQVTATGPVTIVYKICDVTTTTTTALPPL